MLRPWPSGAVRVLCRVNRPLLASSQVHAARFSTTRCLQSAASTDRVPLRKQLKQEAKALKAEKKLRKESEEASRQEWELTVGVEIHAQLNTEAKLFSREYLPVHPHPVGWAAWLIVPFWSRCPDIYERYPQF
jgi:aspartyl-tRNA(Asn)/glutamyl-tRNA(Gln) amidotransferase subunit B